jgi:hypothetical protein
MSGEKQTPITEETIINRVAKDSRTPTPALIRMVNALEEASAYEARLDQQLDGEETLNSIIEEIQRNGFIGGEKVG